MSDAKEGAAAGRLSELEFIAVAHTLRRRGALELTVVSGSMTPVIPIGAKIAIEPLADEPKRFDILVFWDGTRLICHYFWYVNQLHDPGEPPIYVTRNLYGGEDLPIPSDRVLGHVTNFRLPTLLRWRIGWRAFRRGG